MEGARPLGPIVSTRRQEKQPAAQEPPSTPPLLRTGSYDRDAENSQFDPGAMYDDDHSTVDEQGGEERKAEEPFGPEIQA